MSTFYASIVSGRGRGRRLTVPTLNLHVTSGESPKEGVYAVRVLGDRGVMHVGSRPTFDDAESAIEVHLLDFKENKKMAEPLCVEVLGFLRVVQMFDSPEELKKQIAQDIMDAERYW